jgi:hypothetical protein
MPVDSLQFNLPPILADRAFRPDETAAWLVRLPLLNAPQASRELLNQLTALNQRAIEDSWRLKLLELFRGPVSTVCAALEKSYDAMPLPLAEHHQHAAERVRALHAAMATGYKRLVVSLSRRAHTSASERDEAALVTQRAIQCLGQVLASSFSLYAPPPPGTWREMHDLYRFAESEGLAETPVLDALNFCVTASSVSHVYKQALLLDFADPYHLPPRMLAKVYLYLDAFAPLAHVTQAVEKLRPNCQFLLNLATDRAGISNVGDPAVTVEVRYRLLNTEELARHAHTQLKQIENGEKPETPGLSSDYYAAQGAEMLTRLITAWGVQPKRRYSRVARHHAPIEIVSGLGDIHLLANGGVPFARSSGTVGPLPQRNWLGKGEGSPRKAPGKVTQGMICKLIEESAGGFSFERTGMREAPVRVGDLIAGRSPKDGAPRNIALVIWVMTMHADTVRVGVKRLAPSAQAVGIVPADRPEADLQPTLRLPPIPVLKQPETLITPRGLFREQRVLTLDDGYRTHQVIAGRLLHTTGSFEQFEFRFIKA